MGKLRQSTAKIQEILDQADGIREALEKKADPADWNASEGELGYIKNRTHYKKYSLIDDDRIVSMNDVCITINLDYIGAVALVENLLWSDNLVFYSDYNGQWDFDWDTEIFFTAEVNNNLLTISSDTDLNWSEWLYTRIMKVDVLCISEDYIPTSIRSGAAKGATALQSVPAEYVTETELTNKGYATTFALEAKVDKVTGKQLSTEDFTTALKTKLEGLSNYNDVEISTAVSNLQTQLNTLVSGNANDAINSFNEIIAFLDGVKDTQDLSSIIASIEQQIAGKQATISDLDTIRAGASKGATAIQSVKTINGQSIVGSGDITIEGGEADWNAKEGEDGYIKNKPFYDTIDQKFDANKFSYDKDREEFFLDLYSLPGDVIYIKYKTEEDSSSYRVQSFSVEYGYDFDLFHYVAWDVRGKIKENEEGHAVLVLDMLTESDRRFLQPILNEFLSYCLRWESDDIDVIKTIDEYYIPYNIARTDDLKKKQDNISDLAAIRSGASKGATAIQSVKTINGQSIVGSGDITIQGGGGDNVYVTEFTVNELEDLAYNPDNGIQIHKERLLSALEAHKVIVVPYAANDGYIGYAIANGYAEDLLYLNIPLVNGAVIHIEQDVYSEHILGQEVKIAQQAYMWDVEALISSALNTAV